MTTLRELSQYRFAGRSEAAVREEWIRPLLVHLGYGISTLNEVRYEQQLRLAKPFRRIGRQRVDVDYTPTVLGHGLWIIEAKAHGAEEWDDAIWQAWLYATHPEVDVPFIAIADGARIAVYDTHQPDWDSPIVDIATPSLEAEFPALADVLGAANVTRAVRQRRMQHLGLAMRAELSPIRLDEYVGDVRQLTVQARPSVDANMRAVLADQFGVDQRRQRELIQTHGLFVVGVWANQPFGASRKLYGEAVDHLRRTAAEDRVTEFDRLRQAASYATGARSARDPRMFWSLRNVELFVALSVRNEAGCEPFGAFARQAIRDYILNFPDDDLGRAAHRLERVLPAFTARWFRSTAPIDLTGLARDIQAHWSDETRLRARVDADRLFVEVIRRQIAAVWTAVPWEPAAINSLADTLERALSAMTPPDDGTVGLASDRDFVWQMQEDMLVMATLYETSALIEPELLDDEVVEVLRRLAAAHPDRQRVAGPAARLVEGYEHLHESRESK